MAGYVCVYVWGRCIQQSKCRFANGGQPRALTFDKTYGGGFMLCVRLNSHSIWREGAHTQFIYRAVIKMKLIDCIIYAQHDIVCK